MAGETITANVSQPAGPQGSAVETTQTAAAPVAENTNFYDSWGLSEEQIGCMQSKGFKTPGDLLKSYMEAQSFVGMDKNTLIKVPKADADGNVDYSEVFKTLGRPDDVAGYEIEGDVAEMFLPKFLELGITKNQAKALSEKWAEVSAKGQELQNNEIKKMHAEQVNHLKEVWGKDYDMNVELGNEAFAKLAAEMDLKEDDLPKMAAAIGTDKVAMLMLKLAGDRDTGIKNLSNYEAGQETKETAAYKLQQMNSDPEVAKKIMAHDRKTIEELNRLTAITMKP